MGSGESAVLGIVFNDNRDQVLAIQRRDVDVWVLPGGGCDAHETPEEAVIREVLEETGLKVSIKRHVAIYYPINRLAKVTYVFECEREGGQLTVGEETRAVQFFPVEELPKHFFPVHQEWLNDAFVHHPHVIHKEITQVTYFAAFKLLLQHPIKVLRYLMSRLGFPMNKG